MATIKHAKTVTIADPTQAALNAQIALGNYPPGTLLADIALASDHNANHVVSLSTNKLLGRATAGTGAMEEITLGTNLSFTGTTLNAASGAGATYLLSTIDFGATPVDTASLVITGIANMTTTAHINVFVQEDDTTVGLGGIENNADRHETLSLFAQCSATTRVAATGFTAKIRLLCGKAIGKYRIHAEYSV